MVITDAKFTDAGGRIRHRYDKWTAEKWPDRWAKREVRIDDLGLTRWPTDYYTLRGRGLDHESAIREVERRMDLASGFVEPPTPPTPGPGFGPIVGAIGVTGGSPNIRHVSFADEHGPRPIRGVVWFPGLWFARHDFDRYRRVLDLFVAHDLWIVRMALAVGGACDWGKVTGEGWLGREVAPRKFTNSRGD